MYALGDRPFRTGSSPAARCASFDNKYYSKSAATGPVSLAEPYHNDEFAFLQSVAKHDLKIPITGAYTLAVWSYDEHYVPKEGRLGGGLVASGRGRGAPRADARHRAEHHPPEPRGADRPRREVDPDRRAGRVDRGGRARRLRRELQRVRRRARLHLLDPPLLLRLRPLLPGNRGDERLPPVLRRLRELRHAASSAPRRRNGPGTR